MVRVISSVAALAMLFQAQAAPAAKASSVVVDSAPQVVEEQQHAPSTTPTVVVLTPPPTPAVAQTTPTVAATTVAATTTSAPTRRVESTVAPSSSTPAPEEPKRAPSNDAGVQAAAAAAPKETPRAAASSASDALVTFEGVKSVAYQTAYYWIDVAKYAVGASCGAQRCCCIFRYCRDTAVSMLPKDMQGKYNQAVRDGKKYYAQAKDVYYAEVAPKIDPVIDAGTVGVSEVYSFVNEKQKTITAAPFKKMHAAYPATRGIAGSELADRVVFIVLSLSLLSWAVFLFKLPFRCLGYLLCPRRAKGVRSSAPSQSEKAKAQSSNKVSKKKFAGQ